VLCNTYNKNSFTIHARFGTTFLAPPHTITMKLVLFFFLVLASSSLLVNAEYRWDQDAQEWVLVEDSPEPDNYSDTGSGTHYDDEDSDYDDDEGSGDVDSWDEGSDDDGVYNRGVYNKDTSAQQPPTNSLDNSDPSRNANSPYDNNYNYNNNNNNNNMYNNYNNGQTNYGQQPETGGGGGGDIAIVDGPAGTAGGNGDNNFYSKPVDTNNGNSGSKGSSSGGSGHLNTSTTFFAKSGTMAAVIMGAVVGLLCAILCVMFVVYRMRKKDEGSYALDEPKRSPTANSYSKPPNREFYA